MPICAFAAAIFRSAAAISGRRSSRRRRHSHRNRRRVRQQRLHRNRKLRRVRSHQHCNRMFKLRPRHAKIDCLRLHRLQACSRASTTEIRSPIPVSYCARVSSSAFLSSSTVSFNSCCSASCPRISKKNSRQAGLFRQLLILKIGLAQLRVVLLLVNGIAHLAPQIGLPRNVKRQRSDRAHLASIGVGRVRQVGRGLRRRVRQGRPHRRKKLRARLRNQRPRRP